MEEKIKLQLQLASSTEDTFREEEFYEEIEAPKFVDFSSPNHYCPDDRYWFCSRVGCDQRHEEEMDSEAIYKKFVLRVMAARSPNVRLRKALTRPTGETKKCPVSAPPKSSKSRLPRLAIASSLSRKLVLDEKATTKPHPEKPSSTPKARIKHVAAKYMTSVRKKKVSSPNPNAFRSVRNPKKTSITLLENKVAAKSLAFNTPKKDRKVKASQNLVTPITKLCEGMKKMQITQKPSKECKSVRKALASSQKKINPKCARNDDKKGQSVIHGVKKSRDDSSDMEIEGTPELCSRKTKIQAEKKEEGNSSRSGSGSSQQATGSENTQSRDFPDSESSVSAQNTVPFEASQGGHQCKTKNDSFDDGDIENQNPGVLEEVTNNHGKENELNSDKIRYATMKNKVTKADDRNLKENWSTGNKAVKYRKLKPTNPKPFRLRTDERGILKETTLERKATSSEDATITRENLQCPGSDLPENKEKQSKDKNKNLKPTQHRPIKSKYISMPVKGVPTCPEKKCNKPQREATKATSLKPKAPPKPTDKTPAVAKKLAADGRRAATIPKEPKFHNMHKPKGCTKGKD